jgi:hypothetical protein
MKVYYHEGFPANIGSTGVKGQHPPFKSSAGAFYVVAPDPAVPSSLDVFKATDTTNPWSVQDTGNRISNIAVVGFGGLSTVQVGDVIHMAFIGDSNDRYRYATFNMATDLWAIVGSDTDGEVIENIAANASSRWDWISIADVRADGDVIVAYNGEQDKIMGKDRERVDYARRTGVDTWSSPNALDAAGEIQYSNPVCALGTANATHIVWQKTEAETLPIGAVWTDSQGRTLDSANSLSTTDDSTADTGDRLIGNQNLLSYDDSGTQIVLSLGASENSFEIADGIEDGSGDLLLAAAGLSEAISPDIFGNDATTYPGVVSVISFVVDAAGDIHCLYSGGGTAGVDQDIYYTVSTDNGINWSTPVEELDAVTCNFMSANIYVRGTDTVLAYFYDDNGYQKYNEKILIAGEVEPYLPYFPERTNTLLRM